MENYYNISNYHLINNRRLQKEVVCLYQYENHIYSKFIDKTKAHFDNDDISFDIIESNKISFTLINNSRYVLHIVITIPSQYPFRPPSCKLNNNTSYMEQLVKMTGHVHNFTTHRGKNEKCFCCQSLTCRDNWGPKKTIIDMLNEVNGMFELINNKVDEILIKKIKEKKKLSIILKEKLGYDLD
tara:strand:- start:2034 stop:2585 length:552 start_codon:yes stop_codon:yes gene_type:complete